MVVDYTYYLETYLNGREPLIDSGSFPFYVNQANLILAERVLNITECDEVKNCLCELSESVFSFTSTRNIASEKVGDYSVTYTKTLEREQKNIYQSIMRKHLGRTEMWYTGVY